MERDTIKIRLSDFNLMVGMGWNEYPGASLRFVFGYNESDGPYAEISVSRWKVVFPLEEEWQGEGEIEFWLFDGREIIKSITPKYVNLHALLTFKDEGDIWVLQGGPGNGLSMRKMMVN